MTLSDSSDEIRERRGVFSKADRNYLRNPGEYSRQAANERERKIVERIQDSMLDFRWLADPEFPDHLLEQAFSASEEQVEELSGPWARKVKTGEIDERLSDPEMEDSTVEMVATLHRMYPPSLFNGIIEEGVEKAVKYYYPEYEVRDASYDPDIRRQDEAYERAKRRLEQDSLLRDEDVRVLLERGEVDPQRVADKIQEQQEKRERLAEEADRKGSWVPSRSESVPTSDVESDDE